MSTIINTGITSPVTITTSGAYTSPLTITTSGSVKTSGAAVSSGILLPTLVNEGTIEGTGLSSYGVFLQDGGSVANTGTAAMISGDTGVYIKGAAAAVSN